MNPTSERVAACAAWARRVWPRLWPPLLVVAGVVAVFWKLVLTRQYTFLGSPDLANQVMPWLGAQVNAIRHWSVLLWTPYEWFGQSLIGQVQPGVTSPFTFLLALAPLHDGQIQIYYVHLWYVLIHCAAGLFAYWFFADLGCTAGPAVLGAIFYATGGFCGNTEWPQHLAPAIWAPLVFLF
ncbi:MAG: YfhO family protein, partial [Bryobacteraceae bacterium]